MDLNDPVFYDDAIWTQCNTCDEYFDQSKYNSRTCMVCEDNERGKEMNKEYLEAKFELCIKQAEKDLQEQEIARAIKNLQRANSAMARLFGIEEDGSE